MDSSVLSVNLLVVPLLPVLAILILVQIQPVVHVVIFAALLTVYLINLTIYPFSAMKRLFSYVRSTMTESLHDVAHT